MTPTYLINTGVICALGIGARQLSASFRAGLSGYLQSSVIGRNAQPIVLAPVPDAALDELTAPLELLALSDRERRMLRLGGMALRQVVGEHERRSPWPMFLALPELHPVHNTRITPQFIEHLALQADVAIDLAASRSFEFGRAAGLFALQAGMAALAAGHDHVLVGGVDTPFDLRLLAALEADRRLLSSTVSDGFVPGEGAAFLWLSRARGGAGRDATVITAVGTAQEPGHRYSQEPHLGVGLSAALDDALSKYGPLPMVRTCFSGLNGENLGGKEWGVARIRHHPLFDQALVFEHPADGFGDVGAAMAPLLIALAHTTLQHAHRPGPMLVWASSDQAPRGCAFLSHAVEVAS